MKRTTLSAALLAIASMSSQAANIYWADWMTQTSPTTWTGKLVTGTSTVDVTYENNQGIAFFQNGTGPDFFLQQDGSNGYHRNPDDSPFTSSYVENIPTAAEMIGLQWAGSQTLTFSEPVSNLVFAYVSLNSNGYGFDQDFEILSYGAGASNPNGGNNDIGYWGYGESWKNIVDDEYQLVGSGEPHGAILFEETFTTLTWRSLSNEFWNGFTIGVEGTEEEVHPNPVPEPATVIPAGLALAALVGRHIRRRRA